MTNFENIKSFDLVSHQSPGYADTPNISLIHSSLSDIRSINKTDAEAEQARLTKLTIVDSGSANGNRAEDYVPPKRGVPAHLVDGAPGDRSHAPVPAPNEIAPPPEETYIPPYRGAPVGRKDGAV